MTREEIVERLKKGDRFYNHNTDCAVYTIRMIWRIGRFG